MHFRAVKDVIARPIDRWGYFVAGLPEGFGRAAVAPFGILAKASYFMPGSYLRKTVDNFCSAAGRADPWPIFSGMVGNAQQAALHFATLNRYGRSKLLSQTVIDPSLVAEYQRSGNGKGGFISWFRTAPARFPGDTCRRSSSIRPCT